MNISSFIEGFLTTSNQFQDYLTAIEYGGYKYSKEIYRMIVEAKLKKDEVRLEFLLMAAARDGLDSLYSKQFCELLKENWHESHEDIISLLEKIKDPDTVDCIYDASLFEIDYDDGKSLAKKCIWALGAINTTEAHNKLTLLSKSDSPIIREAAIMELEHLRFQD